MPNIASILKAEISRVARKEVRAEIETLKRASAQYRNLIAALRRQVEQLEKEVRRTTRVSARAAQADASSESVEQAPARRFSASRLAAHREKLDLSAAAYGELVGVSGQTVYHWEQGRARPRAAQLESLASVRGLGKRDVAQLLKDELRGTSLRCSAT
ncbi:helix-turn-helix domain-containing protein [Variovorax sp. IB41]|uniref:helix-turn-helix domain-containing protein n=1 Tax=Variovorax sp. IB41 TaxID=2779370 RepID=UPI0018E8947C|nr:helix-turn-helix transcriptional regulator [Variovorax sp. IB41]MBJ2154574.1 helix-turn-helix transcriptional regulator [Variovorax sp. IB41]